MTWLYFVFVQSVFVFVGRPSTWSGKAGKAETEDGGLGLLPPGTRVAALDDDDFVRKMDRMIYKRLGLDAVIRGASKEDILGGGAVTTEKSERV
jgi:hypothetical protein